MRKVALPSLELVNQLIGQRLPPVTYTYDARDAALYALGIGAPADPLDHDELKFVYEGCDQGFQVLPTFAAIYARDLVKLYLSGDIFGIRYNPMMLVHGEQHLQIHRPLPAAATVHSRPRIAEIFDKGSGLLMEIAVECQDETGTSLASARSSLFIRGLGGFGGERGSIAERAMPNRRADIVHEERTLPAQALIYRLAGDRNPLHVDPAMAAIGDYDKPILHGLCSFGFAARAILKRCGANQADRLRAIGARFAQHVYPGETLVTEIWRVSPTEARFQTKAKERDTVVLSQAYASLRD